MPRCLAPLSASTDLVALASAARAGVASAQPPRVACREDSARGDPVLEAALAWLRE